MKRKIMVTINADEKTCGKCVYTSWLRGNPLHPWCSLFDRSRPHGVRCRACLAAERKAREAKP